MNYKKIGVVVLFFLATIPIPGKFHPRIKWRELKKSKFIVIFPSGYEKSAFYTQKKAEDLYGKLKKFWGWKIRGKIRIILSDNMDSASLNSKFFPYNQIEISIVPPEPDSFLGNWNNWIEDALHFELNSLFVFNSGSNFIYGLRKYLGFNTLFFPAGYIPGWIFKGLCAIDALSGGINPMFDENYIDKGVEFFIRKNGRFPRFDALKGIFPKWPGDLSDYFFGIYFIKYLKSIFGNKLLIDFIKNFTNHPLPLILQNGVKPLLLSAKKRFYITFQRKLGDVVRSMERNVSGKTVKAANNVTYLTNTGYVKKYPIMISGGEFVYLEDKYSGPRSLILMNTLSGRKKVIVKKADINAISYDKKERKIYFSAFDKFRSYYNYSDIYTIDLFSKKLRRLTKGKRVSSPVSSGEFLYYIQRQKSGSFIVKFNKNNRMISRISGFYNFLSGLSLSPDGETLAAGAKNNYSRWGILLLNLNDGSSNLIQVKGLKSFSPRWRNNKELLFLSEDENGISIIEYSRSNDTLIKLKGNDISKIRYFDVFQGEKIIASCLNGGGFDIGIVNIKDLKKEKICLDFKQSGREGQEDNLNEKRTTRYNPFRDFLPQYFTLTFRMGGNEIQPGFVASGFDSIMKHYFKFKIMRGFLSKSWNSYFEYLFDETQGTFGFRYTNYTDLNRDKISGRFFKRREKFRFFLFYPIFRSNRGDFSFYSDLHFENESDFLSGENIVSKDHFNGFRVGLSFDSSGEYYDSISSSDGMKFTVSYSREFKRFGSELNINTASLEFREFTPILRPNTLALRFVIANSWGEGQKVFYLGGAHRKDGVEYAGENQFDLMRGFPSGYFSGIGGYLVNLEYRILLKRIERSFLIIKSLEKVYFSFFVDTGRVWNKFQPGVTAVAVGGEMNLIAYIGRYRYVFKLGSGLGINPEHTPVFYISIGNSF